MRSRRLASPARRLNAPADTPAHVSADVPGLDAAMTAHRLAPFLKWAGGKRSLLPFLLPFVPNRIDTYYEPFLGGGALFFELANLDCFRWAVLADTNEELIRCYRAIQKDVAGVIGALARHEHNQRHYYKVRDQNPALQSDSERAARTIFLNRSGYNGLYRVNRAGEFNVPFGRYSRPPVVDLERLRLAAGALQKARLLVGDFEEAVAGAGPGDFVYFDPPYVPVSRTSSFTGYAPSGFTAAEQTRLAGLLRRLGEAKVKAVLSNSDCPTTRRLYRGLRPTTVHARRAINSNAARRGPVAELIVRSFVYRAKR
jgi:DNA adenine methylase